MKDFGKVILQLNKSERAVLINKRNQSVSKLYDELSEILFSVYLDMLHKLLQRPLRKPLARTICPVNQGRESEFT